MIVHFNLRKITPHYFFYSGNYDRSDSTCVAFMAKAHGTPQKTATRIYAEGTVRRKESNINPPSPKPSPVST